MQPIRLAKSEIPDGRSETSPKSNSEADGNEVKSAAAMSVREFQDSKTSRAKTRLMRATKQVSIKVEMLNFHFNTTLDYII